MTEFIAKILLAYLLGSLMGGLIVGRLRGRVDIRRLGSGNAGATNAWRTQGAVFGIAVFAIDIGKGLLATLWLPHLDLAVLLPAPMPAWQLLALPYACGLAVMLGHIYPLFFGFRGGKGVATLLGVVACLLPWSLPAFAAVWVLTLVLSGYVGLASMLGFAAAAATVFWQAGPLTVPAGFMLASLLLVLYTHRANLARLRAGNEHRFERAMLLRRRTHP